MPSGLRDKGLGGQRELLVARARTVSMESGG